MFRPLLFRGQRSVFPAPRSKVLLHNVIKSPNWPRNINEQEVSLVCGHDTATGSHPELHELLVHTVTSYSSRSNLISPSSLHSRIPNGLCP